MVGIYKITNPNNKVYIGQSIDIEKRFKQYKRYSCKAQPKLYNSLNKYGVENHIFEIIKKCNIEELNTKERYYQEKYNAIQNGLNCVYTSINKKDYNMNKKIKNTINSIPNEFLSSLVIIFILFMGIILLFKLKEEQIDYLDENIIEYKKEIDENRIKYKKEIDSLNNVLMNQTMKINTLKYYIDVREGNTK